MVCADRQFQIHQSLRFSSKWIDLNFRRKCYYENIVYQHFFENYAFRLCVAYCSNNIRKCKLNYKVLKLIIRFFNERKCLILLKNFFSLIFIYFNFLFFWHLFVFIYISSVVIMIFICQIIHWIWCVKPQEQIIFYGNICGI